jgi:hypothetical protein
MRTAVAALLALAGLAAGPAAAQPTRYPHQAASPFRHEVQLTALHFANFFQESDPDLAEGMNAGGLEYRAAWRPAGSETDFYGHANYTFWGGELVGSSGLRLGTARETDLQSFNVFAQVNRNRPSFEVGNTYSRANTTFVHGEYSYRVTPDWELEAELDHDRQSYEENPLRDNSFTGLGGSVRYRGFGGDFSPTVGFMKGKRKVENAEESYDNDDYWLSVTTEALSPVWLSVAYHTRGRSYSIDDPGSSNFGRRESGPRVTLAAAWRSHPRVTWGVYYSRDSNHSTSESSNFKSSYVVFSVSYGL